MAVLSVNPTRMELQQLQSRLVIAQRGHKLLKEKQDSLIGQFSQLMEEARLKRRSVEGMLETIKRQYYLMSMHDDDQVIQSYLQGADRPQGIKVSRVNLRALSVPQYTLSENEGVVHDYSLTDTTVFMDTIQASYQNFLPEAVELASIEKRVQMIASELKATRRRVNVLEYKTIPDIEETIVMIRNRIDDNERSQLARMTRMKKSSL